MTRSSNFDILVLFFGADHIQIYTFIYHILGATPHVVPSIVHQKVSDNLYLIKLTNFIQTLFTQCQWRFYQC